MNGSFHRHPLLVEVGSEHGAEHTHCCHDHLYPHCLAGSTLRTAVPSEQPLGTNAAAAADSNIVAVTGQYQLKLGVMESSLISGHVQELSQ